MLSRTYKEFLKLKNKKTNPPPKKRAKDLNKHLTKEAIQMTNKYRKRFSISCVIRKMQIKRTMRYHYTCIRMAKGYGATELSSVADWNAKWYKHFGRQFEDFLTKLNIFFQQSYSLLFTQRSWKLCAHKNQPTDIYSHFIHNCQNLEATKVLQYVNSWIKCGWSRQ